METVPGGYYRTPTIARQESFQMMRWRAVYPCESPDGSIRIAFTEIEARYATGTISRLTALRQLTYASYWAAENPTEAKMAGILVALFGL